MAVTSVSDAAVEVLRVCQDGIRFRFHGAPQLGEGDWGGTTSEPQPYPVQLVVCQGIPNRIDPSQPGENQGGAEWYAGLQARQAIVDAAVANVQPEAGQTADQAAQDERQRIADEMANVRNGGDAWTRYGVAWAQDTQPLGMPAEGTVLLRRTLYVLPDRLRDVQFPEETEPDSVAFLSENYPKRPEDGTYPWGMLAKVTQYGEYTLQWTRAGEPAINSFVAISFEGFRRDRRSADLIAPVTSGYLFRDE